MPSPQEQTGFAKSPGKGDQLFAESNTIRVKNFTQPVHPVGQKTLSSAF